MIDFKTLEKDTWIKITTTYDTVQYCLFGGNLKIGVSPHPIDGYPPIGAFEFLSLKKISVFKKNMYTFVTAKNTLTHTVIDDSVKDITLVSPEEISAVKNKILEQLNKI
jgi:hypothetical protein